MRSWFLRTLSGVGVVALVCGAELVAPPFAGAQSSTTTPLDASPGVSRDVRGSYRPLNAPGQRLSLDRVAIAPGTKIPRHSHAGTIVVRVERGTAVFSVDSGSAVVTGRNGATRTEQGPTKFTIAKGETLVELPLAVYSGANRSTRPLVLTQAVLSADGLPASLTPESVESPAITLTTEISSKSSVLQNADPSLRYGWNNLVGDATVGSEVVHCDMLGNVVYVSGAGPFFGFVTFTWPDGSSIVTQMFGQATPQADGGSVVDALLTIVGGTGRYSAATGFGSFEGRRDAAVGAPVRSVFTLTPSSR